MWQLVTISFYVHRKRIVVLLHRGAQVRDLVGYSNGPYDGVETGANDTDLNVAEIIAVLRIDMVTVGVHVAVQQTELVGRMVAVQRRAGRLLHEVIVFAGLLRVVRHGRLVRVVDLTSRLVSERDAALWWRASQWRQSRFVHGLQLGYRIRLKFHPLQSGRRIDLGQVFRGLSVQTETGRVVQNRVDVFGFARVKSAVAVA